MSNLDFLTGYFRDCSIRNLAEIFQEANETESEDKLILRL